jgi:hypothetical protein
MNSAGPPSRGLPKTSSASPAHLQQKISAKKSASSACALLSVTSLSLAPSGANAGPKTSATELGTGCGLIARFGGRAQTPQKFFSQKLCEGQAVSAPTYESDPSGVATTNFRDKP